MSELYTIRESTPADLDIIVAHRRGMFEAMHTGTKEQLDAMDLAFIPWLKERVDNGRYKGWFAVELDGSVAAGVGLWLLDWIPGPFDQQPYRGYILNVYTAPEYRKQGLAKRLMQTLMDWCYANEINILMLHASDQGRTIYEGLGFTPTNEMRTWKNRT
ncbi:MAG: GNAT family N-acetyltransferase [Anaerolineae bacterium]|nr:GNAT family N-acetyltransferase [Anaerolineae bacterium]